MDDYSREGTFFSKKKSRKKGNQEAHTPNNKKIGGTQVKSEVN